MNFKNSKTLGKWLLSLFAVLSLLSCSTVQIGNDFTVKTFSQNVILAKTTKSEVTSWLGKPMSTGISQKENGDRLVEWSYFYGTGKLPDMKNASIKILQVRFNQAGAVHSYNWSN